MSVIQYAVVSITCTECSGGSSDPKTELVTVDFAEASSKAREMSQASYSSGDAFVIRLTDGAVVAWLSYEDDRWTEAE